MAFNGYQLYKFNTSSDAEIINAGESVKFNSGNIAVPADSNISYNATTGIFTFTSSGNYFVSWFVNTQTCTNPTCAFAISYNTNLPPIINATYPSESIFKTGQMIGSALLSIGTGGGTMKLINTGGTTTYAIGNQVVTAGISIVNNLDSIPSGTMYGAEVYLRGTIPANLSIPFNSRIPFDFPLTNQVDGPITMDTTVTKGLVTVTRAGMYLVDWLVSLGASTTAKEVDIQLINNSGQTIGYSYSPSSGGNTFSGLGLVKVTPAQIALGYSFSLINKSLRTNGEPVTIQLSALTLCSAFRVAFVG